MKKLKIEKTFDTFNPREYLSQYYSHVGPENRSLVEFFVEAYQGIPRESVMLEFGGGPTIYQLITASKYVKEIHFADYLYTNLEEVQRWKDGLKDAFNWDEFFRLAILLEGGKKITQCAIYQRQKLLRSKITAFLHCNAFKSKPLGLENKKQYDVVSVNFVAESITHSYKDWEKVFRNIHSLLKEDGHLIMTVIKGGKYWRVGDKLFPSVNISELHLNEMLKKLGFKEELLFMRSIPTEDASHGYEGMIFFRVKRI